MEDKHERRSAIHFEADSEPVNEHRSPDTQFSKGSTQKPRSLCYAPPDLQLHVKGRAYDHFVAPHELRRIARPELFPVSKALRPFRRDHCAAPSCTAGLPTHWGCN